MSYDDLLPCPFCGSTNLRIETWAYDHETPLGYVCCSDCGAEGPCIKRPGDETGRQAWNRRAALAQPEPEELTDQELLRCARIATPCYNLEAWERELSMMRAAIAAEIRALRDWLVPEEGPRPDMVYASTCWDERQRLRALLTTEVDRAERGDQSTSENVYDR